MEIKIFKIQIDGKFYDVKPGKNLLEACLSLGLDVPYFCYHPALGSVGACRQCAVKRFKDGNDKKGKIVMSCLEPVSDGMIVSIGDEEVKNFRNLIIESLMTNHPHDCPVCDEGGECHLQDMTVMTGHNYRRYDFKKRTFKNQYLGPFINHEMNRCIECYRCVRFYKDYAGGKDLDVFASHNMVYFGRQEEGTLENEFSGNLVEVCPTGVFTDKTLKKHYTRKWDLTNAPSICTGCSVGCNTIVSERYGSVRRIMGRYNGSVNGYFLCDRGRFGYEFVNDENRIKKVFIRPLKEKRLEENENQDVLSLISTIISKSRKVIGIGSPRASLEANFALKSMVGSENFYHGISQNDQKLIQASLYVLQGGAVHSPSLKEMEKADVVFILGEDVTNTAPMIALALRQAARVKPVEMAVKMGIPSWHDAALREVAQDLKSPFFIATAYKTKLDELAETVYHASPSDIARLGFAVASILNPKSPTVKGLNETQQKLAERIASALKNAKNPLIVSGTYSGSEDLIKASANIAWALSTPGKKASLSLVVPECNSIGLGIMGDKSINHAISMIINGEADTLFVLENDLYRRTDKALIDEMFSKCRQIIVLDHLMNETTMKADLLLPVGTFAESEGTFVNNEGRAQRYYNVFPPVEPLKESWRWIRDIMISIGNKEAATWKHFDDVVLAMINANPGFYKMKGHNPDTDYLMLNEKIPRQTPRFSGRTANRANIAVSEAKPPQDTETPLGFSMEGYKENPPAPLISYYWSPGWNSVQSMNKYLNEPNGSLKDGDPGIRLFESQENAKISFYDQIPSPFDPKSGEWMIIPVYHIFGSEELSSKGPAIREKIPEPCIFMNKMDTEKHKFSEKQIVHLDVSNNKIAMKLQIDDSFPNGVAGISFGLPRSVYLDLPGRGKIYN